MDLMMTPLSPAIRKQSEGRQEGKRRESLHVKWGMHLSLKKKGRVK